MQLTERGKTAITIATFSILGRIGGDATESALRPGRPPAALSVSSVGSEAMQPLPSRASCRPRPTFSILGRIGGDATRWGSSVPCEQPASFSILGRIGGDATPCTCFHPGCVCCFQYPRSDRRRCNFVRGQPCSRGGELSVSSVGSEAMQPNPLILATSLFYNFQYPRSDRRRCNNPGRMSSVFPPAQLSVSSVGSEAMQRPAVKRE